MTNTDAEEERKSENVITEDKNELQQLIPAAVENSQEKLITQIRSSVDEVFTQSILPKLQKYEVEITNLGQRLAVIETNSHGIQNTASIAYDTSDANLKGLQEIKLKVNKLESDLEITTKRLDTYKKHTKELEENNEYLYEQVQDVQNRNMRANLVFHRIPEIINEDASDFDQYTEVKHQVATYISEHLELDKETVLSTIVRAHRSRQKKTCSST